MIRMILRQSPWLIIQISARDHPEIVDDLIQAELADGFIAHVPGGLEELKTMYSRTAVGKLGLVLAPNRSPRLVVDSSISNVTDPTTCSCRESLMS